VVLRAVLLGRLLIHCLTHSVMPGPRRAWSGLPFGANHKSTFSLMKQRATLSFSEEFLQAAKAISLADFFTSSSVEDRTLVQITRNAIFAGQNIKNAVDAGLDDLELAQRLNAFRNTADGELMGQVFPPKEKTAVEVVSRPVPPRIPELTMSQAKAWLLDWIETGKFSRFTRQHALDTIKKRGPFSNAEKIDQMVDNALQMLKSQDTVLNLPGQQGTWLVQERFFIDRTA